jgi:hypothetical protein
MFSDIQLPDTSFGAKEYMYGCIDGANSVIEGIRELIKK